jgi:anti-sigma factor RsiW
VTHVIDDLELYAVGALPADRARDVERHLASCPECRAAAGDLDDLVSRLPEAIPPREPSAALKGRILAAAGAEAPRRVLPFRLPRIAADGRVVVMAATLVILVAIGGERTWHLAQVQDDSARYVAMASDFAHGGRTWYMAGVDQWKGMGGNLMQPASGDPAFVLFHDLRGLPAGQVYALWLISPDGKWVRGTSFRADGRELQLVVVGQELAGFERCAVTVEQGTSGKRDGPIVMQSRIGPPPAP